ncbi:MAG: GntP family permease [Kiritimatiellae bacterium]|nr:GntP family permease [Kiritimatiellia bacterium]
MEPIFSTWGALAGLGLAVVLIVRRAVPAYALILGALAGGLLGGGGLAETVKAMIAGTQAMMPSVLRILASGVLVGALVKTGSAAKIADAVVAGLGTRFALAAVALAAMVVTAVGVFVDIAVITVAPVALAVGRKANLPVPALLLAMVGGGKAGNVISPNPNTIAVAEAFKLDLTTVMAANLVPAACALLMAANLVPAACALLMTVLLSTWLARRWPRCESSFADDLGGRPDEAGGPSVGQALLGPLAVIALLALRPVCGIVVDPLVALPAGGFAAILVCGKWREAFACSEFGLSKVVGVSILLIGTGTVAGIVKGSGLNADMIGLLNACHLPVVALAPVSSVLLSGATASTTAGVTIAAQTFSGTLLQAGVPAVSAAAMLHAGGTIFDALPHGSFFHATAGAVGMGVKDRLKLFPFGTLVGATTTLVSTLVYAVF